MPKPNIHPKLHPLIIKKPDGEVLLESFSTKGGELLLETTWESHPAWTQAGQVSIDTKSAKVAKHNKLYGNIKGFDI